MLDKYKIRYNVLYIGARLHCKITFCIKSLNMLSIQSSVSVGDVQMLY